MRAIEERLRPHLDENVASLWLEKWLQIHAGGHPAVFFPLYRLLRTRKDLTRAVTPDKQVVIEGYPRSGNSFAGRAFIMAQDETFDVTRIAHHLHVPAQVVRAAQWKIPTLVLIRRPRDAVLSLVIRDPISVDQALRYYISFYETSEKYRDAYVLGLFEEVTEDFGQVMKRMNDRFGTTFSLFRHDEVNVSKLFFWHGGTCQKKYGETLWERKVQRPAAVRERIKDEIQYDLENPKRKKLIARADAVYNRLIIRCANQHRGSNYPPSRSYLPNLGPQASAVSGCAAYQAEFVVCDQSMAPESYARPYQGVVGMNLTTLI